MFSRHNDDRMTFVFATQEAADLGHRGLGADHLILGMLCNARSPLFGILGAQGLTLEQARETVRAYHEEHTDDLDSARQAGAADRYEEDREALRSIGIDLDKVREAVAGRFGDDLAQGWGERPRRGRGGRGQGRGRGGPGGRGGHGRGPGAFGPGGPGGFGPGGFGPDRQPADTDDDGPIGADGPWADDPRADGPWAGGPWSGGRGRRGPRGRGGRLQATGGVRDAMRAAAGLAREHHAPGLSPEYLLLGILDSEDPAARALIESATTVDELRAAVLAALPESPVGA